MDGFFILNFMAKKKIIAQTQTRLVVDCLLCKFGTKGKHGLINCTKSIVPQVNRIIVDKPCCFFVKR